MDVAGVVAGWRGLSLAVGERLGRPVGLGSVRWAVERSGLAIGKKIGGVLLFGKEDVETTVRLLEGKAR